MIPPIIFITIGDSFNAATTPMISDSVSKTVFIKLRLLIRWNYCFKHVVNLTQILIYKNLSLLIHSLAYFYEFFILIASL